MDGLDPTVTGLVLAGARVAPVCLLLSAFTGALVPWPVGLSLGLALTVALAVPIAPLTRGALALFPVLRELCLGFAFAMAVLLPVLALGYAMRLAEEQLGFRRERALSSLYAWLSAFTFFSLSGHRALVMGLSATLRDVPLGVGSLDRAAFAFGITGFVVDAFAFSVALAMPLLASMWIAGATLAVGARALRLSPNVDRSVRAPLLVLLAGLLAAPLLARVPDAMRTGLGAARAVVQHIAR
jgi:flagellar biosynthesis protein FliR